MTTQNPDAAVAGMLDAPGEMAARIRDFDWAASALGPVTSWPSALCLTVAMMLRTRHPMFLWWGPHLIQFYNDSYAAIMGEDRHPSALGQAGRICWAEIWHIIGAEVEGVLAGGEATWHEDALVPITRDGQLQDVYWTYSYSPVPGLDGGVGGVLVTVQETTSRVLATRRNQILHEVAKVQAEPLSDIAVCRKVLGLLQKFDQDFASASVYLADDHDGSFPLVATTGTQSQLPPPSRIDPTHASLWSIQEVVRTRAPVVVPSAAATRAIGGPTTLVLPLFLNGATGAIGGALAIGLPPRLPFDAAQREFLDQIAALLSLGLAGAQTAEQALAQAVRLRTAAVESEHKHLLSMLQQAPGFIAVLRGPDHVFELTNPAYQAVIGGRDVIGQTVRQALPEIQGQGFFERLDEVYQTGIPFRGDNSKVLVSSGTNGELRERFIDFIYQPLRDALHAIIGIFVHGFDVTERWSAAQASAASERNYRLLTDTIPQIVWTATAAGQLDYYSARWTDYTGRTLAETLEYGWADSVHPQDLARVATAWEQARTTQTKLYLEHRLRAADGTYRRFLVQALPVIDAAGQAQKWLGTLTDVEASKQAEERLLQAERMQAVGKLAGGVAHEVNNMMMAVLGFGELTLQALEDRPERKDVEEMVRAGHRAAAVTQQLLAFSRQQVLQPVALDLREVVTVLRPALALLLGADKSLVVKLDPERCSVHADRGQLDQVLINLVANARDALSAGGTVALEVSRGGVLPESELERAGLPCIRLLVRDNGQGMDLDTQKLAFEPFFTTKPVGQGTGLGLSTVYGIIQQSGGHVSVESAPGVGTTFEILLPERRLAARPTTARQLLLPSGQEAVLVVEDEPVVLELVRRTLQEYGYTVLTASNGLRAIERIQSAPQAVALVLSDVVMPEMTGRELAERLHETHPRLPFLFMSGYPGHEMVARGLLEADAPLLQKPFGAAALLRHVRQLLDNAAADGQATP